MKNRADRGPENMSLKRNMLPCTVWIAAVLLAGALLWFGTASYRLKLLREEVNLSLEQAGDPRRIETPLAAANTGLLPGTWYTLAGSSAGAASSGRAGRAGKAGRAFVFLMLRFGSTALCAAFIDGEGRVSAIVPLGENAGQFMSELPPSFYRFYTARIEKAHRLYEAKAGAVP